MLKISPYISYYKNINPSIKKKKKEHNFSIQNLQSDSVSFSSGRIDINKNHELIYQNKIDALNSLSPYPFPIASPSDIETLNDVFKKNNIGYIFPTSSLSLNLALKYLSKKGQIKLDGKNYAFMIDKFSVLNDDAIKNAICGGDLVKFFTYGNFNDNKKIIEEFKKNSGLEKNIINIEKPQILTPLKAPNYKTIDEIIKIAAKKEFPSDLSMQKQFIDVSKKYFSDCFMPFSYSSIYRDLGLFKEKIEDEVLSSANTKNDIRYLLPLYDKSNGFITYLYALKNNISPDKFLSYNEAVKTCLDNKVFVVLDDISASGQTVLAQCEYLGLLEGKNCKFIIAPLISTDTASKKVKSYLDKNNRYSSFKYLSYYNYKDLGNAINLNDKDEYLKEFKNLSFSDMIFLSKYINGGAFNIYSAITFPYMIPDNSSIITALIGDFFLNSPHGCANKALSYGINNGIYSSEINEIKNLRL